MGRKSALGLGQPRLPGHQTAMGVGDRSSLPATKLCGELWCPSAQRQHCQGGRMWKGEKEISVGWRRGWRGDCATPVDLDRCWVPAWLLLTTPVQGGKQKCRPARPAAGSWNSPGSHPAPSLPPSGQSQPSGSPLHLPGLEARLRDGAREGTRRCSEGTDGSHGTDFSFFFSISVPAAGWFTWPLSTAPLMWLSSALLTCPGRCWRPRMTFSRYVAVMGRRGGRVPPRAGTQSHLPFPRGLPTHKLQSTVKVPCEQSLFGEEKTQGEGISISQHRG